jgi:hypothetical protein
MLAGDGRRSGMRGHSLAWIASPPVSLFTVRTLSRSAGGGDRFSRPANVYALRKLRCVWFTGSVSASTMRLSGGREDNAWFAARPFRNCRIVAPRASWEAHFML